MPSVFTLKEKHSRLSAQLSSPTAPQALKKTLFFTFFFNDKQQRRAFNQQQKLQQQQLKELNSLNYNPP